MINELQNNENNIENTLESTTQSENILPLNSTLLSYKENTVRYSSSEWFNEMGNTSVILAGLGGIGSNAAFLLGRLNLQHLYIYDNDVVDLSNLAGQLYSLEDVGKLKTQCCHTMLLNYSSITPTFRSYLYNENSFACKIMICGFDNMEARKIFFNNWLKHVKNSGHEEECLFIDGRLNAEEFQVLCIQGNDDYNIKKYKEEWLFDDDSIEEPTICSYKQTSYTAFMIASIMVNLLVNFISNKSSNLAIRDLPFLTYYNAKMMLFNTTA